MHFEPRNACETQYYNRAMSEIEMLMQKHPMFAEMMKRYAGKIPDFMRSAIKQHALYYAADMCRGRA
jgi:hypothetical protein